MDAMLGSAGPALPEVSPRPGEQRDGRPAALRVAFCQCRPHRAIGAAPSRANAEDTQTDADPVRVSAPTDRVTLAPEREGAWRGTLLLAVRLRARRTSTPIACLPPRTEELDIALDRV